MKSSEIVIVAKGSGISYSFNATNTKCLYIAKILKCYGFNVTILSGVYFDDKSSIARVGRYSGIKYFMPSIYKKSSNRVFIFFRKVIHIFKVVFFLIYLRVRHKKIHFIFDDNSTLLPILFLLEWMNIIQLVFNIEEWPASHNIPFKSKVYSHAFAILSLMGCKKVICVSSFLLRKAAYYNPSSNLFVLPALTEFSLAANEESPSVDIADTTRFLFCGHVGYKEVIMLIVNAFHKIYLLRIMDKIELVLILHGNPIQLQNMCSYVSALNCPISIKTALTDEELYIEYKNASVLLAPLRITPQDEARFPQKISEYTSLSKPIITTSFGDVGKYFEERKGAIFMDEFSHEELVEKMNFALDNRPSLQKIGWEGNIVGRKYFDYKQYVKKLGDFISLKI